MSPANSSPLRALLAILSSRIDAIESAFEKNGISYPSLNEPFQPLPESLDGETMELSAIAVAAASQLIAILRSPMASLMDGASGMYLSAALNIVIEFNITEMLREAGPKGLHAKEIGERAQTDSGKIGRVLRFLATHHIFREISPDVFANNRISSALDTGKSVAKLLANPNDKHTDTSGISALIGHTVDEGLKGAANMTDNLVDPKTASSQDPAATPANRAFGSNKVFWEWLEEPGNEKRLRRFGSAMRGSTKFFPAELSVKSYDWKSLKKGDLVVDVGGGIGSTAIHLAKAYPDLRFVIQDRASVVPDGIKFFQKEMPDALSSGLVKFQEHDFFNPQPIKNAAVFFMRGISHDWPTASFKIVLKQLRAAAQPTTKLIIIDNVAPYACPVSGHFADIPGSELPPVPEPLLPNLGLGGKFPYLFDMQMMNFLNAQERTVGQFLELVEGTGWKLDFINQGLGGALSTSVFVAI